jgi:hypothetical protein
MLVRCGGRWFGRDGDVITQGLPFGIGHRAIELVGGAVTLLGLTHFDAREPELLRRDSASRARFARRNFLLRCRNLTGQNSALAIIELATAFFGISVSGKA